MQFGTNETIKEQEESLGISRFLNQAEKYTKETFEDIEMKDLYKNALSGKTNVTGLMGSLIKIFGDEILKTIRSIGYILIIIIIHSVIKSISEGMENERVGQVTFYVQYILIVTLIMANFSDSIVLVKDTIGNLVGFINSLLPILLALMITTRKYNNCISCPANFAFNYNVYR